MCFSSPSAPPPAPPPAPPAQIPTIELGDNLEAGGKKRKKQGSSLLQIPLMTGASAGLGIPMGPK